MKVNLFSRLLDTNEPNPLNPDSFRYMIALFRRIGKDGARLDQVRYGVPRSRIEMSTSNLSPQG